MCSFIFGQKRDRMEKTREDARASFDFLGILGARLALVNEGIYYSFDSFFFLYLHSLGKSKVSFRLDWIGCGCL